MKIEILDNKKQVTLQVGDVLKRTYLNGDVKICFIVKEKKEFVARCFIGDSWLGLVGNQPTLESLWYRLTSDSSVKTEHYSKDKFKIQIVDINN